jgi:prephenate dehydrogenase
MKLFNKVAIVGVGLIGGSIGLAVKKRGISDSVIGFARHRSSILKAKKMGVIDEGTDDLERLRDCDLVVLACPVVTNILLSQKIIPLLKKNAILIDVSSTKGEIVSEIKKFKILGFNFIGCHPLAGSEKRGVINAREDLFEDSLCILTPLESTEKKNLEKIIRFWRNLGAKTKLISSPQKHDFIFSLVSHLPHIVSFNLIRSVPKRYFEFSSSSLRDTTRIASSDPEVWCDIFLTNQKYTLKAIERFQKSLEDFKKMIKEKDKKKLFETLRRAKLKRDAL